MININERFSMERNLHQGWTLTETYQGQDIDGNPKEHSRVSHHANFQQVASAILDRKLGDCESLKEMIDLLKNAESIVTGKLIKL